MYLYDVNSINKNITHGKFLMIDQAYIDEIKTLGVKESKEKLAEYAAQFNIVVKKTRSFDNMVADIRTELEKLASEPMPEQPSTGLTISDLIQADDEISGNSVFEDEAKPEAIAALRGNLVESSNETVNGPVEVQLIQEKEQVLELVEPEKLAEIVAEKPKATHFELPENFSPTIILMGKAPGYYTLPWWIYEWIEKNPDWKSNPESCQHYHALPVLKSLIYYIKRDGNVKIRESRNSRFFILE